MEDHSSDALWQLSNVPDIASLAEAVEYATNVDNLLAYQGLIHGSERFPVELPSGGTVSNWKVNCFFGDVFRSFGEEAYPSLAPLLDHEYSYVQVGAYSVLKSAMNRRGLRRHMSQTREERVAVMEAFQAILAKEAER